jgi:hypothetical protein
MADRGDAEGPRPCGQAVKERRDYLEQGEAHQEDNQVMPPTEHRGNRDGEKSKYRQSPLRSHRVQASRERIEPRGSRRGHDPDERSVDAVERAGREVEPERPGHNDDKDGGQPELARPSDDLRQRRRRSGRPSLPSASRRGPDARRRSLCLTPLHAISPRGDPHTIAASPEPPFGRPGRVCGRPTG